MTDKNKEAFLALVRGGLWEEEVRLVPYGEIDFDIVYRLAQEQTVLGLVAAGLDHVVDMSVPKDVLLSFIGNAIQLEERNAAMNSFIAALIGKMRQSGIYAILVKGQGTAQCYERPLWRAAGDVDLLLSEDNYNKAYVSLVPLASRVDEENTYNQHRALIIDSWEVELHGTLRCGLLRRWDKSIDEVQYDVFCGGAVRSWVNGDTQVFLPGADEDIIFIFSHILQHLFREGVGMRQVCDWCRLLWTFQKKNKYQVARIKN